MKFELKNKKKINKLYAMTTMKEKNLLLFKGYFCKWCNAKFVNYSEYLSLLGGENYYILIIFA